MGAAAETTFGGGCAALGTARATVGATGAALGTVRTVAGAARGAVGAAWARVGTGCIALEAAWDAVAAALEAAETIVGTGGVIMGGGQAELETVSPAVGTVATMETGNASGTDSSHFLTDAEAALV